MKKPGLYKIDWNEFYYKIREVLKESNSETWNNLLENISDLLLLSTIQFRWKYYVIRFQDRLVGS